MESSSGTEAAPREAAEVSAQEVGLASKVTSGLLKEVHLVYGIGREVSLRAPRPTERVNHPEVG